MENKLLPCPFCGGEVEFHEQEHHMNNFWNKNTIYCPSCNFMMEETSRLQLFKKWNTRKPMERIVEQLEERIEQTFFESVSRNGNNRDAGIRNNAYHNALEIVKEGGTDAE